MSADLADLMAIHALHREYGASLDEERFDDHGRLWLPGGVMAAFRREYRGVEEILAFMRAAPLGKHLTMAAEVRFEGDRATACADFVFFRTSDLQLFSAGVYRDELERGPDGWRFARREIDIQLRRRDR